MEIKEKDMQELKITDKRIQLAEDVPQEPIKDIVLVALQKSYSPELIEKLMELAERAEKNQARRDFFEAVAKFKAEAPPVKKDKYNNWFGSWYTSLGNLLDTYNPTLGKYGLSLSFPTPEQTDATMTVECRLSHRGGHSDSMKMKAPVDKAAIGKESGKKSRNAIQDIKSTYTYLRSATCEGVLGVSGTEASSIDDDGNSAGTPVEYITLDQQTEINDAIADLYADGGKKFLEFLEVESVETIPLKKYKAALAALKTVRAARKPIRQPGDDG